MENKNSSKERWGKNLEMAQILRVTHDGVHAQTQMSDTANAAVRERLMDKIQGDLREEGKSD